MGEKNLFIFSLKPNANFFAKLVENPFSPLSYRKALSFAVICSFATPEPRKSTCESVSASFCLCVYRAAENGWVFFFLCVYD